MNTWNQMGISLPKLLLPKSDFEKWAVVACDQYTSQPEYWETTRQIAGDSPSALNLILPEVYLNAPDKDKRIDAVCKNMRDYLTTGVFDELPEGGMLVNRTSCGRTRRGFVAALDLEMYDYRKGSRSPVRATEGTILSRIPPRLSIRRRALLELPHVIVLINDPLDIFFKALNVAKSTRMYDFELMQDGGHITGDLIAPEALEGARSALSELWDEALSLQGEGALFYAVGDGNHSLATAKSAWEELRISLTEEEAAVHPARYALVEIENIHDAGIEFEPIHRILFGAPEGMLGELQAILLEQNSDAIASGAGEHRLQYITPGAQGAFVVPSPAHALEVSTLQRLLDEYQRRHPETTLDYIHGADVAKDLVASKGATAFLLPALAKDGLFSAVISDGALERKAFSMGEACQKRYYIEARRIVTDDEI